MRAWVSVQVLEDEVSDEEDEVSSELELESLLLELSLLLSLALELSLLLEPPCPPPRANIPVGTARRARMVRNWQRSNIVPVRPESLTERQTRHQVYDGGDKGSKNNVSIRPYALTPIH